MPITAPPDPQDRYAAILRRDDAQAAAFVYAVRSTGIYCRPGCPARAPLRANVAFYPNALAAAQAGFRPCKRCRPDGIAVAAQHRGLVAAACRQIEQAEAPPPLHALAARAGLSAWYFHRLFRRIMGVTPAAYAAGLRAGRVAAALQGAPGVTQAIYQAGYNAPSRFYAGAPGFLGMAPASYAKGGRGAAICFATGACTLGWCLVAATETGICAVLLGDSPDALAAALAQRFPAAALHPANAALAEKLAALLRLMEAPHTAHALADLPLDIRGTAFQLRVWQALRDIPPGQTLSYSALAAAIGQPNAARAVAQACGANLLAVLVPCHRVLHQDGTLSGYRWGVARKRALLAREAQPPDGSEAR